MKNLLKRKDRVISRCDDNFIAVTVEYLHNMRIMDSKYALKVVRPEISVENDQKRFSNPVGMAYFPFNMSWLCHS